MAVHIGKKRKKNTQKGEKTEAGTKNARQAFSSLFQTPSFPPNTIPVPHSPPFQVCFSSTCFVVLFQTPLFTQPIVLSTSAHPSSYIFDNQNRGLKMKNVKKTCFRDHHCPTNNNLVPSPLIALNKAFSKKNPDPECIGSTMVCHYLETCCMH